MNWCRFIQFAQGDDAVHMLYDKMVPRESAISDEVAFFLRLGIAAGTKAAAQNARIILKRRKRRRRRD